MLTLLLTIAIYGLIFYVLFWGLGKADLGEPWTKIGTVILVVAVVYILVGILTGSIAPFHIPTTLY